MNDATRTPRPSPGRAPETLRTRLLALGSAVALLTAGAIGLSTPAFAADTGLDFSTDSIPIDGPVGVTVETQDVTITNTTGGELPAVITGGLFTGEAEIVVESNTCASITTLGAGASCTYGYSVTPSETGTIGYNDEIFVNGVSTRIFLNVTGHPFSAQPILDFGDIYAGTDNFVKLRVDNVGDFAATVSQATLTVLPAAELSVDMGTCADEVAVGGFCELDVTFSPTEVAPFPVSTITFEATIRPYVYRVDVIGTVLNPLEASSTNLEFGNVLVGSEKELTRTFENVSDVDVKITSAGGGVAAPFTAVQNCNGSTLAPGDFCTYTYTFEPTHVGPADHDGAPVLLGITYPISLVGNGITAWDVSPTDLEFEFVPLGSSRSLDLTVTNQSGAELTIPAHDLDLGEHFTVESLCEAGTELADGESCIITVTFSPTDDNFVEEDAAFALGDWDFAIHAKGLGFGEPDYDMWEMEPLDLEFGEVAVGDSSSLTTTLTFVGEGTGTLFPKDIDLGGPFTVTPDAANPLCAPFAEINVGESCDFIVTFTPTGGEVYSGTDTFNFWGSEFTLTATGTGTVEATDPVVPGDPVEPETPDNDDPEAPGDEQAGDELPKTGADNVQGLLALTALLLTVGAVAVVRSRRSTYLAR